MPKINENPKNHKPPQFEIPQNIFQAMSLRSSKSTYLTSK